MSRTSARRSSRSFRWSTTWTATSPSSACATRTAPSASTSKSKSASSFQKRLLLNSRFESFLRLLIFLLGGLKLLAWPPALREVSLAVAEPRRLPHAWVLQLGLRKGLAGSFPASLAHCGLHFPVDFRHLRGHFLA